MTTRKQLVGAVLGGMMIWAGLHPENALAQADQLSPQELVTRCFQTLADIRLPFNDVRRAGINSQAQALALCDALIDGPRLNLQTGAIQTSDSRIKLQEAKDLVRRFHQFHETFFNSDKFHHVFNESGYTKLIHDTGNPAAYFTLGTFSPSPDYSLAVTEPAALQVVRGGTQLTRAGNYLYSPNSNPNSLTLYLGSQVHGSDRGLFSGMRRLTSPLSAIQSGGEPPANEAMTSFDGGTPPSSLVASGWNPMWKKTFGGGFMGDPSFILLNSGLDLNKKPNGSLTLPRRWSREVMHAALCRNGPYLKSTAPTLNQDVTTQSNAPPFRKAIGCLQCHSAMDPLAIGLRNIQVQEVNEVIPPEPSPTTNILAKSSIFYPLLYRLNSNQVMTSSPSQFLWPVPAAGVTDFHRTRTKGRLTYTSGWDGNQVSSEFVANAQISDQLTELGNLMRNTTDLYLCGSMRYFELLSGVKLTLDSEFLPDLGPSSSAYDKLLWSTLRPIAQQFQGHRNPKTMLKQLIRTPQYLSRSWARKVPSSWIRISSIFPNSGSTAGNTAVTISGANFGAGTTVTIGGVGCTITSQSPTEIQCVSGARSSGTVSVDVQKGTQLDTLPNSFTYTPVPTFTSLQQNIFGTSTQNPGKCLTCHSTGNISPDLSTYAGVLSVVSPGSAINSTLYIRVSGTAGGQQMPKNNPPLTAQEINSIRDWIDSGAPNN